MLIEKRRKMNPSIILVSEGVDEPIIRSALGVIPNIKLKKIGQGRGLVDDAVKFVVEFIGESTTLADYLLEQVTKQAAGASVKVKINDIVIEVNNANRSQLIEVLDKAKEIAENSQVTSSPSHPSSSL